MNWFKELSRHMKDMTGKRRKRAKGKQGNQLKGVKAAFLTEENNYYDKRQG